MVLIKQGSAWALKNEVEEKEVKQGENYGSSSLVNSGTRSTSLKVTSEKL
jgi:hypothetical protein